jgi:hypothetical protein
MKCKFPDEQSIEWVEEPTGFPYLREIEVALVFSRVRPIKRYNDCRVIGYSILKPTAKGTNRRFDRRIWCVRPHDPYSSGGCPSNAVIPGSVQVGHSSIYGRADAKR